MKEMAFQKRKEPSMTLLADKHKSDRSNITFGKGGIWAGLKSMFNSKKPFRTVIFAPIALAVILCFWLALGRSTNLPNNKDSDGTTIPNEAPIKIYYLENATNRDKLERLSSVALYGDGTVLLGIPPISSYLLPDCTYAFSDGELLIYASIKVDKAEKAFGLKNGEEIARFTVVDDNTLVFQSATVPLFADKGARYVSVQPDHEKTPPKLTLYPGVPADPKAAKAITQDEEGRYPLDSVITAVVECPWEAEFALYLAEEGAESAPVPVPFPIEKETDMHMLRIDIGEIFPQGFSGRIWAVAVDSDGLKHYSETLNAVFPRPRHEIGGEPRKWLDYYFDEKMPWDGSLKLELPEYPGIVFQWTPYEVKAIGSSGEKTLFSGMPIWNVYLADLTGDGLPEFCATVSFGSGIVDERILVYDYSTGNIYDLSDRMYYDYALYLDNGRLMVKQTQYPDLQGDVLATGELAIVDGRLTAVGIDRSGRGLFQEIERKNTYAPMLNPLSNSISGSGGNS